MRGFFRLRSLVSKGDNDRIFGLFSLFPTTKLDFFGSEKEGNWFDPVRSLSLRKPVFASGS